MKNTNQIINEWRDAVHLAAEAPSKEEKELITTLPWDNLCREFKQTLYSAHHRSNSGCKYRSDEDMRKYLNLTHKN